MKNVLVTGAAGFVGKNLVTALQRLDDVAVSTCTRDDDRSVLEEALLQADVIYHLAGVNRPEHEEEFALGNSGLTEDIVQHLQEQGRTPKIILPSPTQAELDNPYGRSKKAAEDVLLDYNRATSASVAFIGCQVSLASGPGRITTRWLQRSVIILPVVLI